MRSGPPRTAFSRPALASTTSSPPTTATPATPPPPPRPAPTRTRCTATAAPTSRSPPGRRERPWWAVPCPTPPPSPRRPSRPGPSPSTCTAPARRPAQGRRSSRRPERSRQRQLHLRSLRACHPWGLPLGGPLRRRWRQWECGDGVQRPGPARRGPSSRFPGLFRLDEAVGGDCGLPPAAAGLGRQSLRRPPRPAGRIDHLLAGEAPRLGVVDGSHVQEAVRGPQLGHHLGGERLVGRQHHEGGDARR